MAAEKVIKVIALTGAELLQQLLGRILKLLEEVFLIDIGPCATDSQRIQICKRIWRITQRENHSRTSETETDRERERARLVSVEELNETNEKHKEKQRANKEPNITQTATKTTSKG